MTTLLQTPVKRIKINSPEFKAMIKEFHETHNPPAIETLAPVLEALEFPILPSDSRYLTSVTTKGKTLLNEIRSAPGYQSPKV